MKLYNYDFTKRYLNISLTTLQKKIKKNQIVPIYFKGKNHLNLRQFNQLKPNQETIIESRMNYDFETFESKINLN